MSRILVLALVAALSALSVPLSPRMAQAEDREPSAEGPHHRPRLLDRLHDFALFPVSRGRIGVQIQPMTSELREFMGAPSDRGVLVERVVDGSPAEAAGLRVGDVITEAAGAPVDRPVDLIRAIASLEADASLEIVRVRDGSEGVVKVTPEPNEEGHGGFHHGWGVGEGSHSHGRWHGAAPEGVLKQRVDELERRLRELEKHVLPGMDNAETST